MLTPADMLMDNPYVYCFHQKSRCIPSVGFQAIILTAIFVDMRSEMFIDVCIDVSRAVHYLLVCVKSCGFNG